MTQRVRTSMFLIWGFLGHRYIERVSSDELPKHKSFGGHGVSHVYRGFLLLICILLLYTFALLLFAGRGRRSG